MSASWCYVEVTFEGFAELVDELGGLLLAVNQPVRDQSTGLTLDQADCVTIDGATLLALVRARHLEVLTPNGTWAADPSSDFGRIARAQVLMTAALAALADAGTAPADLDRYSRILADHARLDSGLTLNRLVELVTTRRVAPGRQQSSGDADGPLVYSRLGAPRRHLGHLLRDDPSASEGIVRGSVVRRVPRVP